MATLLGDLLLMIRGDDADARKAINRIEKQVKNFTKFISSAAGLWGAAIVFQKLNGIAKDLIDTYSRQEIAEAKLQSAIKTTGRVGEISTQALYDYAGQLQSVTTYGDEATISAMAMLQQLGDLDEKGLRQLTPLVQDFASAMGLDLEQAASLVGKTLGSTTNSLGRYGVQIDATAPKSVKLAQLIEELQKKFSGMSRSMAETNTGALKQLNNVMADIKEQGGKALLEFLAPAIREMTSFLTVTLQTWVAKRNLNRALKGEASTVYEVDKALATQRKSNLADLQLRDQLEKRVNELHRAYDAEAKKVTAGTSAYTTQITTIASQLEASKAQLAQTEERLRQAAENIKFLQEERAELKRMEEVKTADVILTKAQQQADEERQTALHAGIEAMNERWVRAGVVLGTFAEMEKKAAEQAWNLASNIAGLEGRFDPFAKTVEEALDPLQQGIEQMAERWVALGNASTASVEKVKTDWETISSAVTSSLSTIDSIVSQSIRNREIQLDNEYESRKAAIEANIADEDQRARALEGLDKEMEARRSELQTKAAEAEKRGAIFSAITGTANAVISALQTKPFIPVGLAMAALAGILGAAQIAVISSQPIPKFASGADFIVPPGYPNDSFPMLAESGERVQITPKEQFGAVGPVLPSRMILRIGSREFNAFVEEEIDNRRILVSRGALKQ